MESDVEFIKKEGDVEIYRKKSLTNSQLDVKRDFAKYLTKEQINDVLAGMPASKDKILCLTLWMTGIRVTEAINIKKKDINFKDNILTVRWQKSKKWKNRNLPIKPELATLLHMFSGSLTEQDLLFPISRQRAFQVTKQWFGISPHQFRHSFAVHFLKETKDLLTLHLLLGHSNVKTTMEYLKIVPVDQARVLQGVTF